MKRLILMLFFGTICLMSNSQITGVERKSIIHFHPQIGLTVDLLSELISGSRTGLEVAERYVFEFTIPPGKITYITLFYEETSDKKLDTLFQSLYDWIREIETIKTTSIADTIKMKHSSHNKICKIGKAACVFGIKSDSLSSIRFGTSKITGLKNRLTTYAADHNISIIP